VVYFYNMPLIQFIPAQIEHLSKMQEIREAAFAPVFASFRKILGDEIYELAQQREDKAQKDLLVSYLCIDSGWEVYAAVLRREVVGFIALKSDLQMFVGEIGLNAIDPFWTARGFGLAMYEFAVDRFRETGMKVVVVSTGADASHLAARKAYRKAGFDVEIPSTWMCHKL
jgi:GNAT superfamily N-acetyltransferase